MGIMASLHRKSISSRCDGKEAYPLFSQEEGMLLNLCLHTQDFFTRVYVAGWFRSQSSLTRGSPPRQALDSSDRTGAVLQCLHCWLPHSTMAVLFLESRVEGQALWKTNPLLIQDHNYYSWENSKNVILRTGEMWDMKFDKTFHSLKGLSEIQQIISVLPPCLVNSPCCYGDLVNIQVCDPC